jgi:hypothetical protein
MKTTLATDDYPINASEIERSQVRGQPPRSEKVNLQKIGCKTTVWEARIARGEL